MELRALCEKGEILFVSHVCKLFFLVRSATPQCPADREPISRERVQDAVLSVLFYCCLNNTHLKLRLTEQ